MILGMIKMKLFSHILFLYTMQPNDSIVHEDMTSYFPPELCSFLLEIRGKIIEFAGQKLPTVLLWTYLTSRVRIMQRWNVITLKKYMEDFSVP